MSEIKKIPFSPPDITQEEIDEVVDTLRSGWITTGPKTKLFEKQLAEYCHTSTVCCLSSATAALELSDINKHQKDNQKIECVYLGTLSQAYRNPRIVCDLFSKIPNVNLSFFGKIDDSGTIIKKYSEETRGRIHHGGMVSFLQGQESLQNADILISIGNRDSDMVPSKTFEYMSYCKPIIHLYIFKEDPVIPTLNQYPNALLLDANESVQTLVEQTKAFLDKYSKISVDPKMIRELFYESTPEFSIDLIEEFFTL